MGGKNFVVAGLGKRVAVVGGLPRAIGGESVAGAVARIRAEQKTLRCVSQYRLDVYPLLVPVTKGGRSTFKVPVKILQSRKQLTAFLDSHTLAHLLPKQPWIFDRMTGKQAEVYMPAQ